MRLLPLLLLVPTLAFAVPRDPAQTHAFRHVNPCPATGKLTGQCAGWVVDHIIPLCIGGVDEPRNMQWQQVPEALAKDRLEKEVCRKAKKCSP